MKTGSKLGVKLFIFFLFVGLVPFLVIGITSTLNARKILSDKSYSHLSGIRDIKKSQLLSLFNEHTQRNDIFAETVQALSEQAFQKFSAVTEVKKSQVENYMENIFKDIGLLSTNRTVARIMSDFIYGFEDNGKKVNGPAWNGTKEFYGSWLKQYMKDRGYYDMLLVSVDGDVVYSADEQSDEGINLADEQFGSSPAAECFRKSLKGIYLQDFTKYSFADNKHILFIGAPIIELDEPVGVVIYKIDATPVNTIIQQRKGMGKSGETYLVNKRDGRFYYGSDCHLRNAHMGEPYPPGYSDIVSSAGSGQDIIIGEKGEIELLQYESVSSKGINWWIVNVADLGEIIGATERSGKGDFFQKYINKYGYHNLFLIYPNGRIFYYAKSVTEKDLNILKEEYSESLFGKLVTSVLKTGKSGISDFGPHPFYPGKTSAFTVSPVFNDDKLQFLAAIEFGQDSIKKILSETDGIDNNGNTYLATRDTGRLLFQEKVDSMKSDSTRKDANLDSKKAEVILSGKTGEHILDDSGGRSVLSAFTPVDFQNIHWVLVTELSKKEALSAVNNFSRLIFFTGILSVLILLFFAFVFSRRITGPIVSGVDLAEAMSRGDFSKRIEVNQEDEIGDLAAALNGMSSNMSGMIGKINSGMNKLFSSSRSLSEMAKVLSENSTGALNMSGSITESVGKMNQDMDKGVCISDQSSMNIGQVTVSTEEMNNAIKDIADNSEKNRLVTGKALEYSNIAVSRIQELGRDAEKIDLMTDTIHKISDKTNLLALNATIVAARGTNSGKEFTVIAKEIKDLAVQAKNATDEITRNSDSIKESARIAIKEMTNISEVTRDVTRWGENLAVSIDQHSIMTQDISERIKNVSDGIMVLNDIVGKNSKASQNIHSEIKQLNGAALTVNENSVELDRHSQELFNVAEQLDIMVKEFSI